MALELKEAINLLTATHATLTAATVQLEAVLGALEQKRDETDEEEGPARCPRCGKTEFALADDVAVCAGCNANIRDGQVLEGS